MKIEILFTDSINERCTGMTAYNAEAYIAKALRREPLIQGVCIIDGIAVKFSFSPMSMDGDVFTTDPNHRLIVKTLLPVYVYNNMKEV